MNKNKLLMSQPAKKKNKNKDSKKQKQIKKCILEKTIKKPLKTMKKTHSHMIMEKNIDKDKGLENPKNNSNLQREQNAKNNKNQ